VNLPFLIREKVKEAVEEARRIKEVRALCRVSGGGAAVVSRDAVPCWAGPPVQIKDVTIFERARASVFDLMRCDSFIRFQRTVPYLVRLPTPTGPC
jgi:hypothetical protein